MLSGLNLACFSISELQLQVEVASSNAHARPVLALREDSNFLLVTILWGKVSVDVLLALQSDGFPRDALFNGDSLNPYSRCRRLIIIKEEKAKLGDTISRLKVYPDRHGDDVVDEDVIILWGEEKRIITGSDILGRLLRGIVQNNSVAFRKLKKEE
jgi:hypothetical protein